MTAPARTPEQPWEVHHVDPDQPGALVQLSPGSGGAYVVVWDGDVPRGALWLTGADLPTTVGDIVSRLPSAPTTAPAHRPDLAADCTVVVCTRGRADSLVRCLDSLAGLDPAPGAVLVVDNGPEDPSVRQLLATRPGVGYVAEPRPGLDIARNTGWRTAGTPLVAYTDDDVVVHRRWLGALLSGFDGPDVQAVTGLVLPASLETHAQQVFERYWSFSMGFAPRDFGPEFYAATRSRGAPAWQVGAGANMGFRRDYLVRTGGFDERLDAGAAGCSGDSEMWYRVLADGGTCRYVPSAVCFHEHRRETSALRSQLRAYMRGHVAALLVQYERYGEPGNLHRAFVVLPVQYARLAAARLRGRGAPGRTATLVPEVLGAAGGVIYCLRDPSWRAGVGRRLRSAPAGRRRAGD